MVAIERERPVKQRRETLIAESGFFCVWGNAGGLFGWVGCLLGKGGGGFFAADGAVMLGV
ncbi:hypothetical protein [Achromobacter animicus]|uniref:hypothetical protein n=1 Tax=Achromobacter animicus TaxID=1389935 RepID=UPI0015818C2F|nr:hypothetical protein [Achromobacter animicus]